MGMTLLEKSHSQARQLTKRCLFLERKILKTTQKLERFQWMRLIVGSTGFVILLVLLQFPQLRLELLTLMIFVPAFIALVVKTRKLHTSLVRIRKLHEFLDRQAKRTLGKSSGRAWESAQIKSKNMSLPQDIGLFGSHSLWTLLDETLTEGGEQRLLLWLEAKDQTVEGIVARQKKIQSLRQERWFFTKLIASSQSEDLHLSTLQIKSFLSQTFLPARFQRLFTINWSTWILAATSLAIPSLREAGVPVYLWCLFALVSLSSLSSVDEGFLKGVGLSHHLSQIVVLFSMLERRVRQSSKLASLCPTVMADGPSHQGRKLERVLGFLGTKTNPLLHLIVNVCTPWAVTATFFLERRRKSLLQSFPQCLEELAEFEALGSFLVFDHYQSSHYPTFSSQSLSFTNLFHPLIDRKKAIANDFSFSAGKSLGLLTGSNMSGKSTFLRTLGINQILAGAGGAVFAENFTTQIYRVETCIEVTDSLRDGFSYFYAEVLRLKRILSDINQNKKVLYLIDEIFRGTNNRERQIGSRAVLERLALSKNAVGFVSTHDLELTTLEETSAALLNLHFRESINEKGEMEFSYRLHAGPCPTTNALRIMESEGII